jgi:GntR family histidine utilization transcriptional repressor
MAADPTRDEPEIRVPPLDGEGPMWLQIRRSMALAIVTGEWPAGTRVPAEMSLTERYAASRMTVNKAIQSLASEGLVERRPKTGTVVTARARERPVLEIWDAADTVRRDGRRYGYRLLASSMLPPGAPERADLGTGADVPIMTMLCLHLADDRPFQLEERLVNVDAAPRITRQPLETISPTAWLLANVPWTQARHRISARGATASVAGHLSLETGEACLVVERRTWNDAVPVTMGRFWYPGDDHALEGQVRPTW